MPTLKPPSKIGILFTSLRDLVFIKIRIRINPLIETYPMIYYPMIYMDDLVIY